MSFLKNLNWRFATKAFNPKKKVSNEDLNKILESIHMSPSSFGLQAFHVHVITNQELLDQLKEHSWNQSQTSDCSHYLVFSARTDITSRIDQLIELASNSDPEKKEQLSQYEGMMRGFIEGKSEEWIQNWAAKQVYIALGFAMAACAELQIDSCPMEGITPDEYDRLLENPKHLKTTVTLAIGYREEEPAYPKRRFSDKDLFTTVE
ncbi:MAG: NAD(P)H-dependent oxidoreductase [Candidatus Gracilibacteria bacterium]|nr:NAD(P)H-dependent oxidoreductase [Candidatus Gracilibacteria bacterium]